MLPALPAKQRRQLCGWRPGHRRLLCDAVHDDHTPSFAVNPPLQRENGTWHPIKFRCHAGSCGKWGDEWDLLSLFYPNDNYSQRLKRLRAWQIQYERLYGIKVDISNRPTPPTGDRGQEADLLRYCCSELRSVIRERGVEWSDEEAGFKVLLWADRIASDQGISLEAFVRQAVSELITNRGGPNVRR